MAPRANILLSLPYQQIGFVASKKRVLADITPYKKYFARAKHRDKFFDGKRAKNTYQVLDLIAQMVRECKGQTARFAAEVIDQGEVKATCKKLYDWLYNHIQYHEDEEGIEQLSEPNRAIENAERGIDCDCYSIFISCVLMNLKIPHTLRVVELKKKDTSSISTLLFRFHQTATFLLTAFQAGISPLTRLWTATTRNLISSPTITITPCYLYSA